MNISLVIATLGRLVELDDFLYSISKQTFLPYEIIIVDQNSNDLLESLYGKYRFLPIKVCKEVARGVSYARNIGISYASGDIIAFPDDDCTYLADTLEQVQASFRNNQDIGGLVGQWYDQSSSPNVLKKEHYLNRYNLFNRAGTLVQFFKKDIVETIGGFDVRLGPGTGLSYGSGEDSDYLIRAIEICKVLYAPKVKIIHKDVNSSVPADSKIYSYSMGRMYLLKKHNYPFWFKLANVIYPLLKIPFEVFSRWPYRFKMFYFRLKALFLG